jgi:hypothetical protein
MTVSGVSNSQAFFRSIPMEVENPGTIADRPSSAPAVLLSREPQPQPKPNSGPLNLEQRIKIFGVDWVVHKLVHEREWKVLLEILNKPEIRGRVTKADAEQLLKSNYWAEKNSFYQRPDFYTKEYEECWDIMTEIAERTLRQILLPKCFWKKL